jgi:hypothetical protein
MCVAVRMRLVVGTRYRQAALPCHRTYMHTDQYLLLSALTCTQMHTHPHPHYTSSCLTAAGRMLRAS